MNWITPLRKDATPALNLFHFWAPAKNLVLISEHRQPLVTLAPGIKCDWFDPKVLYPFPKELKKSSNGRVHKQLIWRVPNTGYSSPSEFVDEIKDTGEIVCWFPYSFQQMEAWARRETVQVLLAMETERFFEKNQVAVVFGLFVADQVRYVPGENVSDKQIARLKLYSRNNAGDRLKVCSVMLQGEGRRFIPLTENPL